ncbi:hypothetical protein [Arthrobacter zhaoguopingii]|uniref:hypothetical protein n=1 Tax=Arthrobacter zhaoguopingii TaxID=2681491 RepID=UPI00135710A8|nr:hypothetical protein [Arthrobacter zhaoguopingii]
MENVMRERGRLSVVKLSILGPLIAFSWYIAVWVVIREYIYRFHRSAPQYCEKFHLPDGWDSYLTGIYSWTGTDTGWPLGVKCVFSEVGQGTLTVTDHFLVANILALTPAAVVVLLLEFKILTRRK